MTERAQPARGRIRLATLLVGLNSGLVLVAVLGLTLAGVRLLERLADEQALARVRLAGAAARAAVERSGEGAATSARLLAERPTLLRLLEQGDRPGLHSFLERFRRTSGLSGIAIFVEGSRFAGSGEGPATLPPLRAPGGAVWTIVGEGPAEGRGSRAPSLVAVAPIAALAGTLVGVEKRLDDLYLRQIALQAGLPVALRAGGPDSGEPEAQGVAGSSLPPGGATLAARRDDLGAYLARAPLLGSEVRPAFWIEARLERAEITAPLSVLVRRLVLAALGIAALASLAGFIIARYVAGPVRELTAAAARLGRGDLETPVPRVAGAEVGELAATLEETRRQLGRLTAELRRRQAEGEAILTGVAEGVFSVDRDRRIVYLNPQAAAQLGIRPEEALGRFCGDVLRPIGNGGLRPCEEQCPIVHARSRGAARATERLRLADGTLRTVVVTSSAPAEERQFQVLADETEQEAARRLRDAVLANISHEFKTPLAGQRASLELLREHLSGPPEASPPDEVDDPPERARAADPVALDFISALERGGLRLTQLIDNLLESVRIEAGSPPLRRSPVALDEVIEEAAEVTRPLLSQRGQRLTVDLPFPLPQIVGDAPRLIQVFVNLLANANKFAPEGSEVRIGGMVEGAAVRIWVEDAGPGIPEGGGAAGGPSLFERFVRSPERQADPEASGMGLGLWIVQSIVERHGGRVEVERRGGRARVAVALTAAGPYAELGRGAGR